MNGANALVRTLLASNVDVCFTNPGTSEMHFVAALDSVPEMRCVLGLFEGVVTGAADGYARMAGKPAATLLHLGPGLANGFANVHNAKKGRTPMINIVGEHATWHQHYETPLRSDIQAIASACSDWVQTSNDAKDVATDAANAVAQANCGGKISTLILPADTAWNESNGPVAATPAIARPGIDDGAVTKAIELLKSGKRCTLMMTGSLLVEPLASIAHQIALATGCQLLAQQSNARMSRGQGRVDIPRIPYAVAQAREALKDIEVLILLGANPPASFFAYPDQPNMMAPDNCEMFTLTDRHQDSEAALRALSDALGAQSQKIEIATRESLVVPDGDLTADLVMQTVSAMLPENAVLCDESVSSGRQLFKFTAQAAPHDYLQITGGAIGIGSPLAAGAAVGSPGRKVVSLQADGAMMYTVQGLWTQAREQLDVTTVILHNRAYRILQGELKNVGVDNPGPSAQQMLNLDNPAIDWVSLSQGLGVPAQSVRTAAELAKAFTAGLNSPGPSLIEAHIP